MLGSVVEFSEICAVRNEWPGARTQGLGRHTQVHNSRTTFGSVLAPAGTRYYPVLSEITPAPMNPIPERMPSGNRITSIWANESAGLPRVPISTLASIIAKDAASHTRIVVRRPAGRSRSQRLRPINVPAKRCCFLCVGALEALAWLPPRQANRAPSASPRPLLSTRGVGQAGGSLAGEDSSDDSSTGSNGGT